MRSASRRRPSLTLVGGGLGLTLSALACDATFTPSSSLEGLRVVAVQAEPPYAKPDTDVKLTMTRYDASPHAVSPNGAPRPVSVVWIGGCTNPPGDLYYNCYPQLAEAFRQAGGVAGALGERVGGVAGAAGAAGAAGESGGAAGGADAGPASGGPPGASSPALQGGLGDTFTYRVPATILNDRLAQGDGGVAYGVSYVFFFVCGGQIKFDPGAATGFPLGCYDVVTGDRLGADDFVTGFTPIYSYETLTNRNPVFDSAGGSFHDQPFSDVNCRDPQPGTAQPLPCPEGQRCGSEGTCLPVVPHCPARFLKDCPEYKLVPPIPRDVAATDSEGKPITDGNAEEDKTSQAANGGRLFENLWVTYYSTRGRFTKGQRLVNDPTTGWNDDYGGTWKAPNAASGEVSFWAVLHDNRGGTAVWKRAIFID